MKKLQNGMVMLLSIALLSACGSGTQSSPAVNSRTIKAVIKSAALSNSGAGIAGINLSITVPAGVTPTFKADGSVDSAATVEITSTVPGNQALPGATFIRATTTAPAELAVYAIEAAGFSASDTITIHLKVADGTKPVAGDFKLLTFQAFTTIGALVYDMLATDTNVISLSPTLTTTIQ
ncbi:MAG TPA: hypothetical protein HPP97_08225 [Desulfuromonadales bacterium]|nr:hypothetical protein [Desulfuromonadales bacterium]